MPEGNNNHIYLSLLLIQIAYQSLINLAWGWMQLDEEDEDEDEREKIDHRLLPREKRRKMNHVRARKAILEDYLGSYARFHASVSRP